MRPKAIEAFNDRGQAAHGNDQETDKLDAKGLAVSAWRRYSARGPDSAELRDQRELLR